MESTVQHRENDPACSRRFSEIYAHWQKRSDPENGQALIRMGIGGVVCVYLVYTVFMDGDFSQSDLYTLVSLGIFFIFALIIICWIIIVPRRSVSRRVLGIVVDNGATTAALYFHGILAAPLFVVYLWVSFGNGFRFGRNYLLFSATLAVLGFGTVTLFSEYQTIDYYVTGTLLVGLIALPLYVASLLTTLTKTLELAQSANRAKSNFLATMSHEIRTPLSGLVGISEMLAKTRLDRHQQHYIQLISRSSEWLMRVITDGLDFSKIEAGEFVLMEEQFNLRKVIEELCALYTSIQSAKTVGFSCSIGDNIPELAIGDHLRLTQVLGNLLSNSCKFTKHGEITLEASCSVEEPGTVEVQFSVIDSGPGVPQDKQKLIFEPFQQADDRVVQSHGGTGLGLAIAARIVSLMGGSLRLKSVEGEGSTFSFTVPFDLPEEGSRVDVPGNGELVLKGWARPPRILVAEDHEINREVILSQLQNMGCETVVAKNGLEALERIGHETFDLIFMDCQMPEMDGYEATRRLREEEQDGVRVPIVALTANVTAHDKQRCVDSGMDDYLGKPFQLISLHTMVNKWLPHLLSDLAFELQSPPGEEEVIPANQQVKKNGKLLHNLRNALFAIHGSAELSLILKDQPEVQVEHLERIRQAVNRANELVEDLEED